MPQIVFIAAFNKSLMQLFSGFDVITELPTQMW